MTEAPKRIYIPIPILPSIVEYNYIDLNKDKNLRKNVTYYFYNKALSWFKTNKEILDLLDSSKGYDIIYKLIRHFLKEHPKINWYELRDNNYSRVKSYILDNLS